jgi:hypothetical protein
MRNIGSNYGNCLRNTKEFLHGTKESYDNVLWENMLLIYKDCCFVE